MDFFTIPTATFRVLYGFVIIDQARRKVLHFGVTEHPHTEWVVRQLRGAFAFLDRLPKYLIFDHDSIFGGGNPSHSGPIRSVEEPLPTANDRQAPRTNNAGTGA